MSVAFRRDSDEEHLEPKFELPIPPGPNFVTPAGLAQIEERVAAHLGFDLAADRALFVAKRSGGGRVATSGEGTVLAGEFTLQAPTPIDPVPAPA